MLTTQTSSHAIPTWCLCEVNMGFHSGTVSITTIFIIVIFIELAGTATVIIVVVVFIVKRVLIDREVV
jgi:hypothetical protein